MRVGKFRSADECGGLKETLETEQQMTLKVFNALVFSGVYKFYAYDDRLHAKRYILDDMEHNIGFPVWLNVYDEGFY